MKHHFIRTDFNRSIKVDRETALKYRKAATEKGIKLRLRITKDNIFGTLARFYFYEKAK